MIVKTLKFWALFLLNKRVAGRVKILMKLPANQVGIKYLVLVVN